MIKKPKLNEENLLKVFSKAFHEIVVPILQEIKNRLDSLDKWIVVLIT